MIITKTPFRMSFFGGGTDLPEFFRQYGGAVISTSFDKYCYVNVRHLPPFFDYTSEIVYSKIERVTKLDDIEHPAVKNAMKMLNMHELRITYDADLPARTGLGTSSSFAVGLLNAFYALKGKRPDKKQLADEAIYLERTLCGEAGGWQDQIAAAFGGFNRIDFSKDGYTVTPVKISKARKCALNDNLLLFFTGFTRFSADIQQKNALLRDNRTEEFKKMLLLVDRAQDILENDGKDLDEFGKLLDVSWQLKRRTGEKISTSSIDELYAHGMRAGALGGKLLGAGGGGFLLFYVRPENRQSVLDAMKDLMVVPFRFEEGGTQLIYNCPELFDTNCMRETRQ